MLSYNKLSCSSNKFGSHWFISGRIFYDSITGGTDAFIDVIIKLQKEDKVVSARGTEADIINASVKAYIAGVNRLLGD